MLSLNEKISKVGWRFDNSYSRLPDSLLTHLSPVPVKMPELIILNNKKPQRGFIGYLIGIQVAFLYIKLQDIELYASRVADAAP